MASKNDNEKPKTPSIIDHFLVPEHRIMTEEEKQNLLKKYGAKLIHIPNMSYKDPVAKFIKAKPGDLLEIKRESTTSGEAKYYRVVVNE